MNTPAVPAPVSLLLDPHLAPAEKLVWLVLRLHAQAGPIGPGRVQAQSGLARPTILRALTRLAATGWCALGPGNQAAPGPDCAPAAPAVAVPGELLADQGVGIRGKLLYGILQQMAPIHFTLKNPIAAVNELEVAQARNRLHDAPFRGEALMREYLSLLVDTTRFEDNATPGMLLNPWTNELMQIDRFYPPGVAFET